MLLDARREFDKPNDAANRAATEDGEGETREKGVPFADFMRDWLQAVRPNLETATYAAYSQIRKISRKPPPLYRLWLIAYSSAKNRAKP